MVRDQIECFVCVVDHLNYLSIKSIHQKESAFKKNVLMWRNSDWPTLVCCSCKASTNRADEVWFSVWSLLWNSSSLIILHVKFVPLPSGLKNAFEVLISPCCNLHSNKALLYKMSSNYSILTSLRELAYALIYMSLNELRSESVAIFMQNGKRILLCLHLVSQSLIQH